MARYVFDLLEVVPVALVAVSSAVLVAGNLLRRWTAYLPYLFCAAPVLVLIVACCVADAYFVTDFHADRARLARHAAELTGFLLFGGFYIYCCDVVWDGMRFLRYVKYY